MQERPTKKKLHFLERISEDWWQAGNTESGSRDYYRWHGPDGKQFWIYQDHQGNWYQHGIYS